MTDQTLQEAADELDPIDNLYEANERLRGEVERLAVALGKEHTETERFRAVAEAVRPALLQAALVSTKTHDWFCAGCGNMTSDRTVLPGHPEWCTVGIAIAALDAATPKPADGR